MKGERPRPCWNCGVTVAYIFDTAAMVRAWMETESGKRHRCEQPPRKALKGPSPHDKRTVIAAAQARMPENVEIIGQKVYQRDGKLFPKAVRVIGPDYRPSGCKCKLPPWDICNPNCEHAI